LHEFIELVAPSNSSTLYKTALGGIFVATELHLLTDTSVDYVETWKFLELRLKDLDEGNYSFPSVGLLDSKSIPMAATVAVATSLLEGITSLLSPPLTSSHSGGSSMMPGTKASDYTRTTPKK
jgi:hypothetical protein